MSAAARAVSRGAGRGTSLATSSKPTPVTQLPTRRPSNVPRPATGRGTSLEGESVTARSSLTSSVLRRQDHRKRNESRTERNAGHGISFAKRYTKEASSGGRDEYNSKRKNFDWYSSADRREALAGLAQASSELTEVSKRSGDATKAAQPFAWANLSDVVKQLPDGHWAHGYVSDVASSIERNDAMDGKQKENVFGEVLQALGRLSRENDQRFQDAES